MEELPVVDALVQTSFLVQGLLAEVGAAYGLSVTQVRLLGVLRDREPGMQELAAHLGLDKSSVTGLVDRAEQRGLVRRRPSETDGRAVTVSLTVKGKRAAAAGERAVTASIASVTAPLTAPQRRDLSRFLTALLSAAARD